MPPMGRIAYTSAMIRAILPGLAVAVLMFTGCGSVLRPEVTVGRVSIEPTPDGDVLMIEITAENPNKEPLPLREVHYFVSLAGEPAFEGIRSAESTLRSFGSHTMRLPVALPKNYVELRSCEYSITGQLSYREPGAFSQTLLDADIIDPAVDFAGSGTLPNK